MLHKTGRFKNKWKSNNKKKKETQLNPLQSNTRKCPIHVSQLHHPCSRNTIKSIATQTRNPNSFTLRHPSSLSSQKKELEYSLLLEWKKEGGGEKWKGDDIIHSDDWTCVSNRQKESRDGEVNDWDRLNAARDN